MAHVASHSPGAFAWIELGTTDQNAAKHFYTNLFGWTFNDSPMGPNDFYTMFQLEGANAGAAYTLRPEQTANHVPPHWILYMSVKSADETAARAKELGATVCAGPFDVFTYGRMAVISDPTGAVFSIWEPRDHHGLGVAAQTGSFCWADLCTPNQAVGAKFYSDLFGYKTSPGQGGYLHIQNGEDYIGGIPPKESLNPNAPPHWLIYIQVADCDGSVAKAKQLGANVYLAPMTMEKVGRWSVLADPQGAVFALFQPPPH